MSYFITALIIALMSISLTDNLDAEQLDSGSREAARGDSIQEHKPEGNPAAETPPDSTAMLEEQAWERVDGLRIDSLEAFAREFPSGVHTKDAKVLLLIHRRMKQFRSGKAKPQFRLSTKQLGQRWIDSKAVRTKKDIIGFAFPKVSFRPGVAFAAFYPLGKGSGTITMAKHGVPALPTSDGSILAVKTYGMSTKEALQKLGAIDSFFGGYHFVTPATQAGWSDLDGTVFFGVIEGLGLVHVYGEMKALSPSGLETEVTERSE